MKEHENEVINAIRSQGVSELKAVLGKTRYIDFQNNNKWTALILAVNFENHEAVSLLVQSGADLNIKDIYGLTALMRAAIHNDIKSLNILIKAGANLDEQDFHGLTALMWANDHNNHECSQTLMDAKADLHIEDNCGWTVLMKAKSSEKHENIMIITRGLGQIAS